MKHVANKHEEEVNCVLSAISQGDNVGRFAGSAGVDSSEEAGRAGSRYRDLPPGAEGLVSAHLSAPPLNQPR